MTMTPTQRDSAEAWINELRHSWPGAGRIAVDVRGMFLKAMWPFAAVAEFGVSGTLSAGFANLSSYWRPSDTNPRRILGYDFRDMFNHPECLNWNPKDGFYFPIGERIYCPANEPANLPPVQKPKCQWHKKAAVQFDVTFPKEPGSERSQYAWDEWDVKCQALIADSQKRMRRVLRSYPKCGNDGVVTMAISAVSGKAVWLCNCGHT